MMLGTILYRSNKKVRELYEIYGNNGNIYYAIRYALAYQLGNGAGTRIFDTNILRLARASHIENDLALPRKYTRLDSLKNLHRSLACEI